MDSYWPIGMSMTGRFLGSYAPRMQNITPSMEDKILRCLRSHGVRTFDQLALAAGAVGPDAITNPERFHNKVDEKLRELMACGKVRLVARRPTLCFELGTVLDRIVKELELDDALGG